MEAVPAPKKDVEYEVCLSQLVLFKRDSWGKRRVACGTYVHRVAGALLAS